MKKQLAIVALAGVLLFPSLGLAQTQNASTTEQTTQYLIDSLRAELQTLLMDLVHQLQVELAALTERVDAVAPEGDDDDDGGVAQQQQAQSDDDDDGVEPYTVVSKVDAWLYNPDDGEPYTRGIIASSNGYKSWDVVEMSVSREGVELTPVDSTSECGTTNGLCNTLYYYEVSTPSPDERVEYSFTSSLDGTSFSEEGYLTSMVRNNGDVILLAKVGEVRFKVNEEGSVLRD